MVIFMSLYEEYILKIFKQEHIYFEREKTFRDLKHGLFRFDFYLPNINNGCIVDVDGEYHFKPIRGRRALIKQQEHDRMKNSYCLANNIPLYRIPYWELSNIKKLNDILDKKYLVTTKWWNDEIWLNYMKKM